MYSLLESARRTVCSTAVALCVLFIIGGFTGVSAQSSAVDAEFNPNLARDVNITAESATGRILPQPDGKTILSATYFDGTVTRSLTYRVNADGTRDATFNCAVCADLGLPIQQPDGKLVFAVGVLLPADGSPFLFYRVRFVRVNTDGSLANEAVTVVGNPTAGGSLATTLWAVQPDGKFYLGWQHTTSGTARGLFRINPDFTVDNSFTPLSFPGSSSQNNISDFLLLPDGRFFVSAGSSLARYNPTGSRDMSFESPTLACSFCPLGQPAYITNFERQSTGKLIISGAFSSVNGVARQFIARLEPAGNVDLSFTVTDTTVLKVQPDDKILILGFSSLQRLNADGSPDNTFNAPAGVLPNTVEFDSLGRLLIFARLADNRWKFARLNANGTLDTEFASPTARGAVTGLARRPDGKIVIAGDFNTINNVVRNRIAVLNADGTPDPVFNPNGGFDQIPFGIAAQPDSKIIAAGSFTVYDGMPRTIIVRLNLDGTLDSSFNPIINGQLTAIAVQADGKILISGFFSEVNGIARNRFARLNPDGSLDTAFNPILSANPVIYTIFVEPDGKIDIGGAFTGVNGFARSHVARLNADGSTDTAFNAGTSITVNKIVRLPDGKYLILYPNTNNPLLSRRNPDGSVDNTFQSPTFTKVGEQPSLHDFAVLPNGSVIVGGSFDAINGTARINLARLRSDGVLDSYLAIGATGGRVRTLLAEPDGKIIVGGFFSAIENVSRTGLGRLNNALSIRPLFDFDGDGRSDLSVFRPSNGSWYITNSSNNSFTGVQFGTNGDLIAPADYDGDGKTDFAVFRPSDGTWYLMQSTAGFRAAQFGASGDIPVPGDFDGDGKANLAVFRPSTGSWYIARATGIPSQNFDSVPFGQNGDKPIAGADFDGDGKADVTVFRPSDGNWYRLNSSNGQFVGVHFGIAEDKPVAADYDGDGKTDLAVFRPSDGVWYRINSGTDSFAATQFGVSEDRPSPGDFDGDGRADLAVFRPSQGTWYLLRSTSGFTGVQFGANGDIPTPNAFVR
ncbi:MAG TPA: FG-GAP-like repeat-containing protein [Pyrinomonadaceae bacterium]|jgi:uncharacterized delta-60 repeat protein